MKALLSRIPKKTDWLSTALVFIFSAIFGFRLLSHYRQKKEFNQVTNATYEDLLRQLGDLQNGRLTVVHIDTASIVKHLASERRQEFLKVCNRHLAYQRQAASFETGKGSPTFKQALFRHLIVSNKVLLEYLKPR